MAQHLARVIATLALVGVAVSSVAQTIPNLPAATSVSGSDLVIVSQGSTTKKASVGQLLFSGTASQFSAPWGISPAVTAGASHFGFQDSLSSAASSPGTWVSRAFTQSTDATVDYSGASGATIPSVYSQVSTSGGSNIQAHAIMAYCLNGGSQDCVASSGRAYRASGATSTTSGLAEATGMWGSAYNYDSGNGFTAGIESAIYNNISGTTASDLPGISKTNGLAVGAHISSFSNGSRADALMLLDSWTGLAGQYGAWNGILLAKNIFTGTAGEVGINGGSWTSTGNYYPDAGIKLGYANSQIWCSDSSQGCQFRSESGVYSLYGNGNASNLPTTATGLAIYANTSQNSYIDFYSGTTHGGNLFYSPSLGYMVINSIGSTDTHLNINGGSVYVPAPSVTDSSNKAATTAFVTAQTGNFSSGQYISANTTVTKYGQFLEITASSTITTTLTTPTVTLGSVPRYEIWNNSSNSQNITATSAAFYGPAITNCSSLRATNTALVPFSTCPSAGATTISMAANSTMVLVWDGGNWIVLR